MGSIRCLALTCLIAAQQGEKARKSYDQATEMLKETAKAEVTFYTLNPDPLKRGKGDDYLRTWLSQSRKPVKDAKALEEVRAILGDNKTYEEAGALCFLPGMGLRFKTEDKVVDLVICLKCSWIYFFKGEDEKLAASWALSESGVSRLLDFYKAQAGEPSKK